MKTSNIILLSAFVLILVGITSFLAYFKAQVQQDCVEAVGTIVQKEIETADFNSILVNNKVKVELIHDTIQKVVIQAEENLIDNFSIYVKNGQLKISRIYCMKNPNNAVVKIFTNNLEKIKMNSGGKIYSFNTFIGNSIEIEASAGADFNLDLNFETVYCKLSAGAMGKLKGKAKQLNSEISAGSNFKASKFIVDLCTISAASGANAEINVTGTLTASASSGANIHYYGNPRKKIENASSGGNIKNQQE